MQVELLTLSGAKFRGEATEVSLRTANGMVGILPHHEPLTAIITAGPLMVRPKGKPEELFVTFGGVLEVRDNVVRLLVDEAEHADELIHDELAAALERAQALRRNASDRHELRKAQELIDRHGVRLEVVRLKHRHRSHHDSE